MSAGLEHRESADALGAYALGALSESEALRVRHHLDDCRECSAQLEWLRVAVDVLPASVPPVEPPPALKIRLMEIVEAEAELLRAAGEAADRVPPASRPPRRWRWPWQWLESRALAPGLALAATFVAATVLVLLSLTGGSGTRTIRAQITAPALAGHVAASLRVHGSHAELLVRGLPVPPANHVDELWIKRGGAPPKPAGTFVLRSGSVQVAGAVHRGDSVLMTVEPGHGTGAPTTAPLLVARA